jgi:hypothetical protein
MNQPGPGGAPYYAPNTRRKRIGCGTGCLLVIVGVFLLVKGTNWWEDFTERRQADRHAEEQAEKRAEIEGKIRKFGREYATVLLGAIEDLESFTERDRKRLEKLEKTLTGLGRVPEEDEDWRRLKSRLREVESKRESLVRQLEEAYLLYQKYLINSEPSEQQRYEEAIATGEKSAKETKQALEELLRDSSGE